MRVIAPSAWRAQPWRNGAGTTHEIVRVPDTDAWRVRVSVADVTSPAPFSAFPGVARWLYLLAGGPVVLDRGGARVELREVGDAIAFSGDEAIAAIEVARPSRDLNVMIRGAGEARFARDGERATGGVFAIAGDIRVDGAPLAPHHCAWDLVDAVVAVAAGALAVLVRNPEV